LNSLSTDPPPDPREESQGMSDNLSTVDGFLNAAGAGPSAGAGAGGGASDGDGGFAAARYTSPLSLLTTFNPERILAAAQTGSGGMGSDPAISGPVYVFVTRPDLNLGLDLTGNPAGFLSGGGSQAAAVQLAASILGIGTPVAPKQIAQYLTGGTGFIPLLTNMCRGFQATDIVMDITQVGEGWTGARLPNPKSTLNSRQDGVISLEFGEWDGLPVSILHKIWVDYQDAVGMGYMFPKGMPDYASLRVLDFACSIYAFHMMADGVTIQWGARWTGCFPTAQPHSAMGGQIPMGGAPISVTVPYSYSFYEPMDAAIFAEFNLASPNSQAGGQVGGQAGSASPSGVQVVTTNPNGATATRSAYYLSFDSTATRLKTTGGI
jgi:hypothetical protein